MTHVNTIFIVGFVLGAIFAYTGIMGFISGCITGIIISKNHITSTDKTSVSYWLTQEKNTELRFRNYFQSILRHLYQP
jgi:hypothetical protein